MEVALALDAQYCHVYVVRMVESHRGDSLPTKPLTPYVVSHNDSETGDYIDVITLR